MDHNCELLNYIYQNAQMGVKTLRQLIEIVKDSAFLKQLVSQLQEYEDIQQRAMEMLHDLGHEEKEISNMATISAYMSISFKTAMDRTNSHIAEMLIRGSTMGVVEATKNIKHYTHAEPEILELAEKLLKTEQSNIEKLKAFL